MFKLILRAIAITFIGFFSAVFGFVVGSIFFTTFIPEFVIFGREGYEAGGPIGFILGAVIGLSGSSVFFFGKRTKKGPLASSNADSQITPQ